jgi:CRP/FNR family transcriptional regulator, cyclic AMP receptor protein
MDKISHLHNWMQNLDGELLQKIQKKMTSKHYSNEEQVYAQGDQAQCLYQVKSGRVKVCNYSSDGKEMMFSVLRESDCFGEMSLIDQQPRFNHISAMGGVELKLLAKADFLHFYQNYPAVSQALNLMFCRRLRFSFHGMEGLTLMDVRERLALTILREAEADVAGVLRVDLSQEMLGKMLNATRQSVGKELKFFESQGWIEVQYGKIVVTDAPALRSGYESLLG